MGKAGRPKGMRQTEETKQKLRDCWTPERREAHRERMRGVCTNSHTNHTPESKKKLSDLWTPERRAARSEEVKAMWAEHGADIKAALRAAWKLRKARKEAA